MSLPLLITINALIAVVLLAGLAYAMSRTTLLKAHVTSGHVGSRSPSAEPAPAVQPTTRPTRPKAARQPASTAGRVGSHVAAAHGS